MKKSRQCFNANQIEELEKLFITTNYPDTLTRQQLAAKMKVSESRIQVISFTCNLLLTPLSSNPQTGQTHSNNLLTTADDLFEFV